MQSHPLMGSIKVRYTQDCILLFQTTPILITF
nr:MAG TPA: hypothetical protein [Caudoviricetes sp.]